MPVRLSGSGEVINASIGMLIRPSSSASSSDLTRSRGQSNKELQDRYRAQQRDSYVSSGRDFCKSSGRHTLHVGGQTFVAGAGENKRRREEDDDDDSRARMVKRNEP